MKLKKQFRAMAANELSVDVENRSVSISFSSEQPVERWYGTEILSHENGAVDLSRVAAGAAPLLFNHDPDQLIGTVKKAWVGPDKRGYADVVFSKSTQGEEKFQQLQEGVLKNVSFGYMIEKMQEIPSQDGKPSTFIARDFQIFEISFVSIPADQSVGYGRADEEVEKEVEVIKIGEEKKETIEMSDKEKEIKPVDVSAVRGEAMAEERSRISAISALGDKYKMNDLARQLIEGGKSLGDAREAFLEKITVEQKPIQSPDAAIGMQEKDVERYSFSRLLNAIANPHDRKAVDAAKYEIELSQAAAKKSGSSPRGYLVPVDVLRGVSKRDLTVGTASAGGDTVATNLIASSFVEVLRNKSIVQSLGATVLNGLTGNVAIPRATSSATSYWVAESGSPTEGAIAFDQISMSPKTVGAYVDYSRKLLLQSSISVDNFIKNDLAKSIAIAIDLAALYGLGSSNQPTGIKLTSGINTVDFGAAAPTFLEMIDMETQVAADNADMGNMAYLTNAAGRGSLKGTKKDAGSGEFVWGAGNEVNGYKAFTSNQVASGDYFFANWADLLIGFWSGLDLAQDLSTGATSGTVRIVALQDCDIAVRHAVSFCRGNNTL